MLEIKNLIINKAGSSLLLVEHVEDWGEEYSLFLKIRFIFDILKFKNTKAGNQRMPLSQKLL